MQKKLFNFLFSTRLMGMLFITYFVAMAVGTFLDQGQETHLHHTLGIGCIILGGLP